MMRTQPAQGCAVIVAEHRVQLLTHHGLFMVGASTLFTRGADLGGNG
jgi:hypothetical protein